MNQLPHPSDPSRYNVFWSTPSVDSSGSLPLGNGRLALNVWLEPSGDLCFYLATGDAWGEFGQLYKLGKLRVRVTDINGNNPFAEGLICWGLDLASACVLLESSRATLRVWADANHPCTQVLCTPKTDGAPLQATVSVERWRRSRRVLGKEEMHHFHDGAPYEVFHGSDRFCETTDASIGWFHHNESSCWKSNLEQQGLLDWAESSGETDPLLYRTFGGIVRGAGWRKANDSTLLHPPTSQPFGVTVSHLTLCPSSPKAWTAEALKTSAVCPDAGDDAAWKSHCGWWTDFWSRSYIHLDGDEAARKVSRGYALQRFLNACAGRGDYPIKFNGSLFTADWGLPGENLGPDYRRWGPGYWHQNTRLPYWAMLASGDFEMMRAYFEHYRRILPLSRERCRKFRGHDGAFFLETMTFWGTYLEGDYGWPHEREEGLPPHLSQNQYIRLHNSSGLEVVHHALLYFQYTGDIDFVRDTLLPLAEAVMDYYDTGFPRRDGNLHITPAQVIEQWWEAENPLPELAGLHACLTELLTLPEALVDAARAAQWHRLLGELPPVPEGDTEQGRKFLPAERWGGRPRNVENPELYAVFPYHLCSHATDNRQTGVTTFKTRAHTHDVGWAQDGMQAALLGLGIEARNSVTKRLIISSAYARFPGFWGPGFDWLPDQDQGGSAAHALQLMILQHHGGTTHILPAWPEEWSVTARFVIPGGKTVDVRYSPGKAPELGGVTARDRVVVHAPQAPRGRVKYPR